MVIFLFVLLLLFSWLFVGGASGIKFIRHNVERMLPVIFIILGLAGENDIKEELKYIFTFTTVTGALLLFSLLIIKSRGSWFGLGIMVALLPILLYKINKISFKLLLVIESLLLIIAIGTYFAFYEALHLGYDFVRPGLRIVAWNIFLDYPIAGIEPSNFISNYTNENFINPLANVKGLWT